MKFQTKVPTDISVLTLTIDLRGSWGWHSHPGLAVIAVAEGTGKLYSADCRSKTFGSGEAFIEGGDDAPTVFKRELEACRAHGELHRTSGCRDIQDEADPGCGLS